MSLNEDSNERLSIMKIGAHRKDIVPLTLFFASITNFNINGVYSSIFKTKNAENEEHIIREMQTLYWSNLRGDNNNTYDNSKILIQKL